MTRGRGSDLALIGRLLGLARPWWPHMGALTLVYLLAVPLALAAPLPLAIAVDGVLGGGRLPGVVDALVPEAWRSSGALLALAGSLVVSLALLQQVQGLGSNALGTLVGEKLVLDLRARLFSHAQRLSLSYHDTRGITHSIYRIQWDAPSIQHVAVNGVIPLAVAGLTLAGMLVVTARIDPLLAAVALAVSPLLLGLTRAYRRPLRVRYREVKDLETRALSVVQEVLSAVRVVKAFGKEDDEERRFMSESSHGTRARIRLSLFQGGFDTLVGLTTAAGMAAVLVIGVHRVEAGLLSLGSLLVVMAYVAQLYGPLRTLSNKTADIQASLTSAERDYALLDEQREVPERPDARPLSSARGAIAFERVSFGYSPERRVIHAVSFEVAQGQRVGIAGHTGAGKTTLVSLLTRFYDPLEGRILLDGIDLRDLRLKDLRRQFAIVLQEPVLFAASIGENIAYARPGARFEEIVAATRAANAHDFVSSLPDGYATAVGERGMKLSGGERQRIALARAFLKDAPILIMDEPTSSVDVKTEEGIMQAMERLMSGRTTFLIAHRLSTLDGCDLRLELKEGRLLSACLEAQAG